MPDPLYPHIILSMPGYGNQSSGAGRGFWRATRRGDPEVAYSCQEGSLLAANFNAHWCLALNASHRGCDVRYFAMQHADVEPEDWWLDKLIAELDARELDVLGVVIPIKDRNGTTSLALERPDGDTWRPLCRLTMRDVYQLPETFTSDDLGHPLLLNTGLWVCKWNPEWCRKVHFTINDRIVFDKNRDCYTAQVEPEDWYFSRLCHEIGLKVGATRKVSAEHLGSVRFTNTQPWGESYDSAYLDKRVIPDPADGFEMPKISGWLHPREGATLAKLARNKRVLEIGSYLGLSTVCLARSALHVTAVDPHDGRSTAAHADTLPEFLGNLESHGVLDRVRCFPEPFGPEVIPDLGVFDFAFIDGDHSAECVRSDSQRAMRLLKPDGLIAFHDYASAVDPGVTAVVNEIIAAGGTLLSVVESLAVVRPPVLSFQVSEV